jgi:hypothetical protein
MPDLKWILGIAIAFGSKLPLVIRRFDALAEDRKMELAARYGDKSYAFIEYSSRIRKLFELLRAYGCSCSLADLALGRFSDWCPNFNCGERRRIQGFYRDRIPTAPNPLARRRTDNLTLVNRVVHQRRWC